MLGSIWSFGLEGYFRFLRGCWGFEHDYVYASIFLFPLVESLPRPVSSQSGCIIYPDLTVTIRYLFVS